MRNLYAPITILALIVLPQIGKTANAQPTPFVYNDGPVLKLKLPSNPSQDLLDHFNKINHDRAVAKEKARLAALEKARLEKQRAAEMAAQVAKESVAPKVYQAPAVPTTSGCTTYHSTGALEQIILHESGGNTCATNAGDCFGLLQACPGAPLRSACGGNPDCQIAWFITNKTGGRSWETIWALWQLQGWW